MSTSSVSELPAISLEVLPATNGDCLLVSCPTPEGTFRTLIDAGSGETWPILKKRLHELPIENGHRHINLAIITHIDHDHIGGARLLFEDKDLGLTFGDIWFNARHHLVRGVKEGESLATTLGATDRSLNWNVAFGGGAVVTPGEGGFVELRTLPGHPLITILSPTPKRLSRLAAVWDSQLKQLRRGQSNTLPEEASRGSAFPALELLAAEKLRNDTSAPNGSSIVILLEHEGASALLTGDAFPKIVGSALLSLAKHRDVSLPIQLDAFKLSHHGSRANLLPELLEVVRSEHYIVSTDNSRYGHPNDETLARVLLKSGPGSTLWFNYATEQNLRWADPTVQKRYGFSAQFSDAAERGLTLGLPAGGT